MPDRISFLHTLCMLPLYRLAMRMTRRRGELTLARLDAAVFRFCRRLPAGRRSEPSITLPCDPHYFGYLLHGAKSPLIKAVRALSPLNGVVVDVGANAGLVSVYALERVSKGGAVFAFEPSAQNYSWLSKNCEEWRLLGYHCESIKAAVGASVGKARLSIHPLNTHHAIETRNYHLDQVLLHEEVDLVSLQDWAEAAKVRHIDLLKIDAEGFEPQILQGATDLIKRQAIDYIIAEICMPHVKEFLPGFCREHGLTMMPCDGVQWRVEDTLSRPEYVTDCLLCRVPMTSAELSEKIRLSS